MSTKLYVAAVIDLRADTTIIGENREKQAAVPILTRSEPGVFLRGALTRELRNVGFTVIDQPKLATRTLEVGLGKFWTEESPSYHAEIVAHFRILDRTGAVRWEGVLSGTSTRFGKSLSVENYQESMSGSMISLIERMLGEKALLEALDK